MLLFLLLFVDNVIELISDNSNDVIICWVE